MRTTSWRRGLTAVLCGATLLQAGSGGCATDFVEALVPSLVCLTLNVLLSSSLGIPLTIC